MTNHEDVSKHIKYALASLGEKDQKMKVLGVKIEKLIKEINEIKALQASGIKKGFTHR